MRTIEKGDDENDDHKDCVLCWRLCRAGTQPQQSWIWHDEHRNVFKSQIEHDKKNDDKKHILWYEYEFKNEYE